ncbi:peptide ABC transporter substrate-binding protein [Candidatus Aerophobetes bacterium]|uniref:Peptide ABC transporter substrate-binding protein n=1 Tax=Aerophobetes bacterium TaxID=2030807 RepID=A0A662D7H4_UNCAE|nr:MAG: peptide ABC transporter substrate-binding protein [Candidatus Aerophobetes bacterium]
MKVRKKGRWMVVLFALSFVFLSLATGASFALQTKPIVLGTTDKITVLDPAKTYDFYTWEVFQNIGEGLLKYKPGTTELMPGIAKSYEISSDGLEYTFKLREGLKFTDGHPLDAAAVKWSIDRVMKLNLDPSWLVSAFVDRVEVVDTYTVRFILKKPVSFFPALVATTPYVPVSPDSYPADKVGEPTVGHYGPYRIKKWVRDVELVLEANPDYYGSPPKSRFFVVKFYKNAATMKLALETGEIDVAWKSLRPIDIIDLKSKGKQKVLEAPGPYIRYIICRCNKPPFNDVKLRRAVAAAIDRERLCKEAYKGTVEPLYSMVPMGMWSHIDAFKQEYGERNLALAKRLLTEAGYSKDNPFNVELWYTPTHYGDLEADVAAIIKESLEETGMMKVQLKSAEWATYAAKYITAGTMPIFLLGWYPDYIDPDDYTSVFLHSEWSPDMGVFYSNPKMDEFLDKSRTEVDIKVRTELYKKVQKLMAEEAPVIPLFQGILTAATQPSIKGVILDPVMLLKYYLIYRE